MSAADVENVDPDVLRRLLIEARSTIDELVAENNALRAELVRWRFAESRRNHPSSGVCPPEGIPRPLRLVRQ